MKIYKTQLEIENDVKKGVLEIIGDVKFECSFRIEASIKVTGNIFTGNISAENISARNISAGDISARNIFAGNISAGNISAWDISAGDISAGDISAENISAGDISAENISFYAVCFAYRKFICKTIKGSRENSKYFCLDSEVIIKNKTKESSRH